MIKILVILVVLLLSSKVYSWENVIGLSGGCSTFSTSLSHKIHSTYKNPEYDEWMNNPNPYPPKPDEYTKHISQELRDASAQGCIMTLEYQARLAKKMIFAINIENTRAKVKTDYNDIKLDTNAIEVNLLVLLPLFQTKDFSLRFGAGFVPSIVLLRNNSKDLISNPKNTRKSYVKGNAVIDVAYNISKQFM